MDTVVLKILVLVGGVLGLAFVVPSLSRSIVETK